MTLSATELTQIIRQGVPSAEDTGFEVDWAEGGRVQCRSRYSDKHLRPGGTISGPTLMGLADAAMFAVILAHFGRLEMAVTTNLNINFLNKPAPADVIAIAEPLKIGKRNVVLDVRLYSDSDKVLVAHATGTYSLPPRVS